jgi:hypothetical protein
MQNTRVFRLSTTTLHAIRITKKNATCQQRSKHRKKEKEKKNMNIKT